MATGELIKVKRRSRDFGTVHTYHADEALAAALPPLAVPRMGEESRAALRAVIDYEKPPANGSMSDCLALAEARGFCADPRDWVPDFELPGRHLPLYQPWVDWLSENGLTRFHEGNTLTFDNWDRSTPKPLTSKLRARAHSNQEWIADVVMNPSRSLSASDRALILGSISAGGQYHVVRQWQVTLIQHFLNDSSAKVREAAQKKLDGMEVLESEEMYAQALAQHLTVENGRVSYAVRPEAHSQPFSTCWSNTTFAALAQALGLTPAQLAHGAELDFLDSQFVGLATWTGDVEVRTIIAQRLLATGSPEEFSLILFRVCGAVTKPATVTPAFC